MIKNIYDAVVIGTGCGGYSAADWLYKQNITNIAIITENQFAGTSRNTGSDKQTYYKLSLDGATPDCAYDMAKSIQNGGSCDGEIAYNEAVNSSRCFYRLVEYGVPFPTDEFGGFPGYQTDHDETKRATSCGPLTSKIMTEKLEDVVLNKNKTTLFNQCQVIKISVKNNHANAVIVYNKKTNQVEYIMAKNIIVASGAPACVYSQSVYPQSQHGMTGVLVDCGVSLCNFEQWQYGMASTDFRWNVSGSYMQVIPRVVSVDSDGVEREFLADYFDTTKTAYDNLFLKGYQWPFSYNRMDKSSQIDMAVHSECLKGRTVYLDYTQNPINYDFETLLDTAKDYLIQADAVDDTPIKRLAKLNSKAIDIYKSHNIDLYNEKLKIAVCAQHNNGGVYVDSNNKTSIDGLYVIGEASGVFGIARPGGTALNDTQVGGLVCSKHIKNNDDNFINDENIAKQIADELQNLTKNIIIDDTVSYDNIPQSMSDFAGFIRDKQKCELLLTQLDELINNYPLKSKSVSRYFYDLDMLLSAKSLLQSIVLSMDNTGSRGGAAYIDNGKTVEEVQSYRDFLAILNNGKMDYVKIKPVPKMNCNFEKYLSSVKAL